MANHPSALKRHRQSLKRRLRNQGVKSSIKSSTKRLLTAIEAKNSEQAQIHLKQAIRTISKAASKGVIHKRNAARKISKLTKKVNAISQPA